MLSAPGSGCVEAVRHGLLGRLHVDDDRWLILVSALVFPAPAVKPADDLAEEIDSRSRDSGVRKGVVPRSDPDLGWHGQLTVHAERRVRVAVVPAPDEEGRTADPVDVSSDRALAPVGAIRLMPQPFEKIGLVPCQALLPESGPVTIHGRVRRHGVPGNHPGPIPADVVVHPQAAPAVVAVVGVAIVREIHRHDRGQVGWLLRSHLQAREAAIGDPDHVDVTVRPWLRAQPLHAVVAVELLLGHVLVDRDAVRAARAADVDPGHHIPVSGDLVVHPRVSRGYFVLAIRQVVHHHRQLAAP